MRQRQLGVGFDYISDRGVAQSVRGTAPCAGRGLVERRLVSMNDYAMRLSRDVFRPGHDAPLVLPGLNRALFVLEGAVDVEQDGGPISVLADQVWCSGDPCT